MLIVCLQLYSVCRLRIVGGMCARLSAPSTTWGIGYSSEGTPAKEPALLEHMFGPLTYTAAPMEVGWTEYALFARL